MTATGPRAARRKLAHEAYQLRCMGHTWHQIAEAKGYASPQSAQKIVSRYIARMPAEDQAMARALAAGTYQLVIGRLSEIAEEAGDAGDRQTAVKALLGIADVKERHVRLTGLQAPVAQRLDVTVHQSPTAVIDRAEEQLLELMAAQPAALPAAADIIDAEVVEPAETGRWAGWARCGRPRTDGQPCRMAVDEPGQPCEHHAEESP